MSEIGLPEVVGAVVMAALTAYALLGGADFGGGVWDLFAAGPRRERQRETIAHAIGPIWEANHVWLILAIVLLFTCFPGAFARLGIVLHIPLTLMLIGIVLRGSAFTFRSYDERGDAVQRRWGTVFAIASLLTPILLGVCIGAVASGRVGDESYATFADLYVRSWLSPFTLGVGALALALFAFLAAVYLTLEADDSELCDDFRRRAIGSWVAAALVGAAVLLLARSEAPMIWKGLIGSRWAVALHLLNGSAALLALWALLRRRFHMARVAAAAQVSFVLWGWALAQYPYVIPTTHELRTSAATEITLRLVLWALAIGAVVLIPSLYYLFRVFKGRNAAEAAR